MADFKHELNESEDRFRLLIDNVTDYAIFMLDPNGIVTSWNRGAMRLKQYSEAEAIGLHLSAFYPEEDRATKPANELAVAIKEGRYEEEGWRIRKDGSRFWANVVLTPIYDAHQVHVGFAKVTRDLTGRRQAEETLRQSEERLNLMVTSVRDYAIFMLSPTGIIETWNVGAERLKGYRPNEIIGKHFSIFYPESEKYTKPPMELEVAAREGRYEEEGWRLRKDGTQFWANVIITALRGPAGDLRGFAKVTRDLTERRKAEEARLKLEQERIARAEAERANRIKDEFLAVVSHELRTPLTPIIGWSKVLQSQRMTAEQTKALKTIERNANTQVKLIEDLLDISSIVSGKIKLEIQPVGLAQAIEASIDSVRAAALAKNIRIQFIMEDSVGPINGDAVRLQQIFWNLLTNAVKFTPKDGLIEIRVRRADDLAQVVIKDTGEGIPADFIPHVFERFSQVDSSSSRKHGGLGIGLYVVRQLVKLHGGKVEVESEGAGKGTTFIVELPTLRAEVGEAAYPLESVDVFANTSLLGKTVMVVDDEEDARDFLSYALRQCGADVILASSARDALTKLISAKVDVLVSDIGMPGEDGYRLIQTIRSEGSMLPAIAVTAFASGEDAVRATNAGFQRHLPKPVNPIELCAAVAAVSKK
jgi:PAS domain S-box-containing protein